MTKPNHAAVRYLKTIGSTAALLVRAPWTERGRMELSPLSRMFGHGSVPTPELPPINVEAIGDERVPVVLRELTSHRGEVTMAELAVLARLVRTGRPRALFEIGTFDGRTTLNMAANAPDDAIVYTLDLPPDHPTQFEVTLGDRDCIDKPESGVRVHRSDLAGRVRQLYGDSATFDFAPYVVDFVFVDGSHAYEYAHADSLSAISMLRNGKGTIVWHDYNQWPGVSFALHELRRNDPHFRDLRWIEGTTLAVLTI